MRGGGAYFIISRTLGIEFGGGLGLLLIFANVFGATMNLVGLTDFLEDILPFFSSSDSTLTDMQKDLILIGITLVLVLIAMVLVVLGSKLLDVLNYLFVIILTAGMLIVMSMLQRLFNVSFLICLFSPFQFST